MPTVHWRAEADNWARFARSGTDSYEQYRDAFYDDLVPPVEGIAIDIGCGEGRTTRDLSRRIRTIGIDASTTMISYAKEADPTGEYAVADAAELPFREAAFDLAIAYNSLMDVDDMSRSVSEATRVLKSGGHFCVCILHPMADAGRFTQRTGDAPFVIDVDYLARRSLDETIERAGVAMRFKSVSYPLQDYARAFEDAGLVIQALREPSVREEDVERDPTERRWQRIPLFLFFRLLKL